MIFSNSNESEPTVNQSLPEGFMDRLWNSYVVSDERRKKTFYYLYYVMAFFILLWITKVEQLQLPWVETKINFGIAFFIAPAILIILMIRYLYLCAYSFMSYISYLDKYMKSYSNELENHNISFITLYSSFKLRDMTDKLNIYLFPVITLRENDSKVSYLSRKLVNIITNIIMLTSVAIPIIMYLIALIWIAVHSNIYLDGLISILAYIFYVVMGFGIIYLSIHFNLRARPARRFLTENIYKENTMRKN